MAAYSIDAGFRRRVRRLAQRMREDGRKGSAAIEFAIVAPVFFLFLFGIIESGIIFFAGSTLQYAADDVARLIRTGQVQTANMTATQFRNRVCADISPLLACNSNLQIDVEAFTNFGGASYPPPLDASGNLNPALAQYNPGTACQVALVRLFYTWHILTPMMAPLLNNMSGSNHLIVATGAFRNEPFAGSSC